MRVLLLATLCLAQTVLAWDKHQVLTRAALANEKALDRTVQVVPIEEYLKKNFGPQCTWERAKDAIFDGVGRDFVLYYQSNVPYSFKTEWEKANNILSLWPEKGTSGSDPQRLGSVVSAREVVSTYSDEPDWKLDDDVARLGASNALAEAQSGTATRALRHFWTPGEEFMGVNLGKGQETDQRMQLYYELAMIAFDSDQDYWGYRLLGDSVHYLQDMSQPYHVQLIINMDMLDIPMAVHRLVCDVDRTLSARFPDSGVARCTADETLSKTIVDSAWYVGTYHGLFEDFALALLETNGFAGREAVAQDATEYAPIVWRTPENAPLLDLKSVIRQAQKQIVGQAEKTAAESLATFGKSYVRNQSACEKALMAMGQSVTLEYQMGSGYYMVSSELMKNSQFQARARLVTLTHSLQRVGATWTRQFVREATAPKSAEAKADIEKIRQRLKARCK